nr:phosphatase PAP2 family protein [Streptomyces bambusae]
MLPAAGAVGVLAARALPGPLSRRTALLAGPVAVALVLVSLPVRDAWATGAPGAVPVLLVLLGTAARRAPAAGLLVGAGAAFQPSLLLFAVLLWATGRRSAARTGAAAFAGCTALGWGLLPGGGSAYGLLPAPDGQSLYGALLRLGVDGPAALALWLVLAAAVARCGLRRAVRYACDGQPLTAAAVTGCTAVVVSPGGGTDQLLWVLLALAGRAGVRAADRRVWPVTAVLVTTLPGDVLLPHLAVLAPVRDGLPLLAALAVACAVPFLPRSSPYWAAPRPAAAAGRPNLLLELLLIRIGYALYSHIRAAAPAGRADAEAHATLLLSAERLLGLDIEHAVNRAVVGFPRLEGFFDFYYTSFHFTVPLAVLGVLYWRRPADYRRARAALGLATVIALAGFWLFPLAPPRLMPGLGFVDTVHGPQDLADPQYGVLTGISNQYAAMPSLHFGWSLWCAVVVVLLAPKGWQRLLGALHPVLTACTIVATANHWVLDAAGGAVVVAAGFALVHALWGPLGSGPAAGPGRLVPVPVPRRTAAAAREPVRG